MKTIRNNKFKCESNIANCLRNLNVADSTIKSIRSNVISNNNLIKIDEMMSFKETERSFKADVKFRGRNKFKISTYNVRTLFQAGKFHQLCSGCSEVNIDFIAIQEHRWIIEGDYELEQKWSHDRNYLFMYASADAKSRNGGVGFLIKRKHVPTIKSITKISSRIIAITIKSNPELTIICAYAPTNSSNENDKNLFYDDLTNYFINIPHHNMIFVAGDFNARLGLDRHQISPNIIGKNIYYKKSNILIKIRKEKN